METRNTSFIYQKGSRVSPESFIFHRGIKQPPEGSHNDSEMPSIFCTVSILYCLLNIVLQSTVIHCLNLLRKRNGQSTCMMLSLHLCATELSISLVSLLAHLLLILPLEERDILRKVLDHIVLIIALLFTTVLYFIKLFIFLLKVSKIHLGLRYQMFWTKKKSDFLVGFAWSSGILFFSIVSIADKLDGIKPDEVYNHVIVPGSIVFFVSAIVSNTYLLYKLNRSRIPPHEENIAPHQRRHQQRSFWEILIESQFSTPVLIGMVFTFFLVSASVGSFLRCEYLVRLNFVTSLLFNTMILLDALIYLLVEPQFRIMIRNRLRRWRTERFFNHEQTRMNQVNIDTQVAYVTASAVTLKTEG